MQRYEFRPGWLFTCISYREPDPSTEIQLQGRKIGTRFRSESFGWVIQLDPLLNTDPSLKKNRWATRLLSGPKVNCVSGSKKIGFESKCYLVVSVGGWGQVGGMVGGNGVARVRSKHTKVLHVSIASHFRSYCTKILDISYYKRTPYIVTKIHQIIF